MSITIRPAAERGETSTDWLTSYHTFSFGGYHDPAHTSFGDLRVINDDVVAPGKGFGMHPHRDMEILTWIVSGALTHRDSMGNADVIRPGEAQRMTAGTGVVHSEWNESEEEPVRLLQIWIEPARAGLRPGYEKAIFPREQLGKKLTLVASPDGAEGSVRIRQDARVFAGEIGPGEERSLPLFPSRRAWVQVYRGSVTLEGRTLAEGDGAAMTGEERLDLVGVEPAGVLVFDLR
jgi:redox-sensitive bicupin YhaK (pirin superfamily)